jgi:hypothetical protein
MSMTIEAPAEGWGVDVAWAGQMMLRCLCVNLGVNKMLTVCVVPRWRVCCSPTSLGLRSLRISRAPDG